MGNCARQHELMLIQGLCGQCPFCGEVQNKEFWDALQRVRQSLADDIMEQLDWELTRSRPLVKAQR